MRSLQRVLGKASFLWSRGRQRRKGRHPRGERTGPSGRGFKSCAWFPKHSDWFEMTNAPSILVVEDEEDSVLLFESAFRKAQFSNGVGQASAHLAAGARAARFEAAAGFWPGGAEVNSRSSLLHSLIVIILTSSAESRDVAAAYRAGADSYLVKPTNLSTLTEFAIGIRSYWLGLNVPPNEPK